MFAGLSQLVVQVEALAIFSTSVVNNIRIEPEWIPQEQNKLADYLICIINYDDWSLDHVIFEQLDSRWVHMPMSVLGYNYFISH